MNKDFRFYQTINRVAILIPIIEVLMTIVFWQQIPEQIPSHYNAAGVVDNWQNKTVLFILFFAIFMLAALMSITTYILKLNGLSKNASEVDKRNLSYIYPMMAVSHLMIQMMFLYILVCSALSRNLGNWFLPVVLILVFVPIIYYIVKYEGDARVNAKELYQKMAESGQTDYLETEGGECYRTKIDWWLFLILIGSLIMAAYFPIHEFLTEGTVEFFSTITTVVLVCIYIPMFRTRYILYPNHMTLICITKLRIPYKNITNMKETHNPLSSAAMSLDRIQIDFINAKGGHEMVLVSPVRKKEFICKVEAARNQEACSKQES